VQACERFIYVENLDIHDEPKGSTSSGSKSAKKKTTTALSANTSLMRKLRKAFDIAKGEEEEVSLSLIGQALRRLDPSFDPRSYGHGSLSSLINALKDKVETRREEKGNTVMVRFKG
jgi:hypothetical protein